MDRNKTPSWGVQDLHMVVKLQLYKQNQNLTIQYNELQYSRCDNLKKQLRPFEDQHEEEQWSNKAE